MEFCRRFHITPAEWADQPAHLVAGWMGFLKTVEQGRGLNDE